MDTLNSDSVPIGVIIGGVPGIVGRPVRRRVCRICGQHHASHEPHVYDYVEEVDEDFTCHICLQPLVIPVDTPCGHTFCRPCLLCFLKVQQTCPIDRKPLTQSLCTLSSLILKKLLEKLKVKCPNTDHCDLVMQRGDLEDHLKLRCPGNWVSCPHSAAGCDIRGPQKMVTSHTAICPFQHQGILTGIERSPIAEGGISYIEIPRTQTSLGIAIVGGSDTPLRCVVIQEVFPDGLIAVDGRLQAGDQIIEIDRTDMTSATHHIVCQTLRRNKPVLRLGIYREKVDTYKNNGSSPTSDLLNNIQGVPLQIIPPFQIEQIEQDNTVLSGAYPMEPGSQNSLYIINNFSEIKSGIVHVSLIKESGRQLGIKLGGRRTLPGIYIMELLEGSIAEQDGRLHPNDRILSINGADVRYAMLDYAFKLIKQCKGHVTLIASRKSFKDEYGHLFRKRNSNLIINHSRTKSAPDRLIEPINNRYIELNNSLGDLTDTNGTKDRSASCESLDYSVRSGQISRIISNNSLNQSSKYLNNSSLGSFSEFVAVEPRNESIISVLSGLNKSSRSLVSPTCHLVIEEESVDPPALPPRSRQPLGRTSSFDQLEESLGFNNNLKESFIDSNGVELINKSNCSGLSSVLCTEQDETYLSRSRSRRSKDSSDLTDLVNGIRKSLKIDINNLHQKTVTISKDACESLGMRIGGGVSSNEGDTPIYIANIHPQGPVGKSKKVKKGDILLSVNGQSLLGLTHTQAVSLLKSTAELAGITLSLLEGPETFTGPANFVPSWLFWQRLPRSLHLSKSVILQRIPGSSLGFSIVGGHDTQRGPEPIHVLFVVSTSPASTDGKLRCGDRILSVDGHSLESVTHTTAVTLLKNAGKRVHLEVVSWLGTEL